jgi:amino acid transporter
MAVTFIFNRTLALKGNLCKMLSCPLELPVKKKFLSVTSLVLLQIVIVANLQPLSANAIYGFTLPFLYLLAAVGFFLPCMLMVAELSTTRPQTGGAYIWVEQAFNSKFGFFTVALLWISNLLWYPAVFSIIASDCAYIIDPALATHRFFIMGFSAGLFWMITLLNCLGIRISSIISTVSGIFGVIIPILLIIFCGIYWWHSGNPLAVSLEKTPIIPDYRELANLGSLIAIVGSLFGMELPAVHAGNVVNPKRAFPKSILISGIAILMLSAGAAVSISLIVPGAKLSVVTGMLDALTVFFNQFHLHYLLLVVFLMVLLGNMGSVMAWMLGCTRGMFVACQKNHVAKFLQKTNRNESPVGVLLFEAVLFTMITMAFLVFPKVSDSFWLLLVLTSQTSLIYYVILFIAALRLRPKPTEHDGFRIPGGTPVLWFLMILGICTSVAGVVFGFFAPADLKASQVDLFHILVSGGLIIALLLPLSLLVLKQKRR